MNSSLNQVSDQIKTWQQQGLTVVLVTGVFDLLHIEHLRFLQKAKTEADKLVAGVETDTRVRQIKGPERPINPEDVRLEQLNHLKSTDLVFLLPSEFSTQPEWEALMNQLHPDLYAVSSHSSYLKNKQAICQKYQISFKVVHQHNPIYSTSRLISQEVASEEQLG